MSIHAMLHELSAMPMTGRVDKRTVGAHRTMIEKVRGYLDMQSAFKEINQRHAALETQVEQFGARKAFLQPDNLEELRYLTHVPFLMFIENEEWYLRQQPEPSTVLARLKLYIGPTRLQWLGKQIRQAFFLFQLYQHNIDQYQAELFNKLIEIEIPTNL